MDVEKLGFEEALKSLEEVVRKLEGEEISLDESLRYFEEGVALSRHCERLLREAEKKVSMLMKDAQGVLSAVPLEQGDEEEEEEEEENEEG